MRRVARSSPGQGFGGDVDLALCEQLERLFATDVPHFADLDEAHLAVVRDAVGRCIELNDQHFEPVDDLEWIAAIDLADDASLILPSVAALGSGIAKKPAQFTVFRFVRRKLGVNHVGVLIHLTIDLEQLHGQEAIRNLATEQFDRLSGHREASEAEICGRREAYDPRHKVGGEEKDRDDGKENWGEIHFFIDC